MMTHLTGANCAIYLGGQLWAAADFEYRQNRGKAAHSRTGYLSDINYPGKLGATITCKNIMKSSEFLGKQITATAITGSAGTIKSGISVAADGWTDSTSPTIATASRVRLTVATAAMTTAGYVTVIGTAANGARMEEDIYVGTIGIGEYATGTKLFKTVTGVYVTDIRSTGSGTLTLASITGASYYTVSTSAPELFTVLMQGVDDAGNYVKVQAANCWISSSVFKSGDANLVLEDAVTFEVQDLDTDLSIWDETTN